MSKENPRIKFFPKDEWGRIKTIILGRYALTWQWPTGKMLRFMWGREYIVCGRARYWRLGPLTLTVHHR